MKEFQKMDEENTFKEAERLLVRTLDQFRLVSFDSKAIIAEARKREEENREDQKMERLLAQSEEEVDAWDSLWCSLNDARHGEPQVLPLEVRELINDVEYRVSELNNFDVYGLNLMDSEDVALQVGVIEDALYQGFVDYAGTKRNRILPEDIEFDVKTERIKASVARVRFAINRILADFYSYLEIRFGLTRPAFPAGLVERIKKLNAESKFDEKLRRLALAEIPHLQGITSALENRYDDVAATRITNVRLREAERHLPKKMTQPDLANNKNIPHPSVGSSS